MRRLCEACLSELSRIRGELCNHKTRLNQADVKTRTKSSVSLWSLFIEFEVKQGRPLRAKTLLQRALVECPWAKGEAFQASRY